jgi:hypothetical protein
LEGKYETPLAIDQQLDHLDTCSQADKLHAWVLLQIAYAAPLAWWTVFLPLWIGHGGHLLLVLSGLLNAVSGWLHFNIMELGA